MVGLLVSGQLLLYPQWPIKSFFTISIMPLYFSYKLLYTFALNDCYSELMPYTTLTLIELVSTMHINAKATPINNIGTVLE